MKKVVLVILIFFTYFCNGQDVHYSQYYFNPIQINPGFTGVFEGKLRGSVSYRDQWTSLLESSSFKTIKASADYKLPFRKNDFVAFGISLVGDEVGENNFRQTLGSVFLAYHKKLFDRAYSKNVHYISGGLKATIGQNSLGWSNLWFGRQYDIGAELVNTSLPSGENLADLNSGTYTDFGAGISWYAVIDKNSIYAGFAIDHLAEPNISLLGNSENLAQKISINMGGAMQINDYSLLMPSVLFLRQGPYQQINFGSQIRYSKNDWNEMALRIGLFARYARKYEGSQIDALIATTAIEMGRIIIGISYDLTMSSLENFNNRKGAFEFNLSYRNPNFSRRQKINCPKF